MKCPICKLENPPNAERCDCGYEFTGTAKASVITQSASRNEPAFAIGFLLIVIGLAIAGYFAGFYETSIGAKDSSDRIQNIGLLQNRQSGISGGLELSILGALIMLYGKGN